jgi:hypothetical protein
MDLAILRTRRNDAIWSSKADSNVVNMPDNDSNGFWCARELSTPFAFGN